MSLRQAGALIFLVGVVMLGVPVCEALSIGSPSYGLTESRVMGTPKNVVVFNNSINDKPTMSVLFQGSNLYGIKDGVFNAESHECALLRAEQNVAGVRRFVGQFKDRVWREWEISYFRNSSSPNVMGGRLAGIQNTRLKFKSNDFVAVWHKQVPCHDGNISSQLGSGRVHLHESNNDQATSHECEKHRSDGDDCVVIVADKFAETALITDRDSENGATIFRGLIGLSLIGLIWLIYAGLKRF